ncbi:Carnitine O-acetyltransferase-like [Oopsacas minuta]|uniref:Carnitine O-acetyltransferase-like n=1 Tax=Oopsacas minuta TaxID=111878 RepID=A0AAV7KMN2_9METZ|nr:Carnitine O-acetyltransferase-like [Oopsacas minuta]
MSRYAILPKLPVPALSDSLDRFLTAMKPLITQSQFSRLLEITNSFSKREGPFFQDRLIKFAEETDNWALCVWVDIRFLSNRSSLLFTNGKPAIKTPYNLSIPSEMLLITSQYLCQLARVLETIRDEELPQEMIGDIPQSMSQYRRLLGAYRIPHLRRDSHVFSPYSKHIIVMYAGRIFKMPIYSDTDIDRYMSVEEIHHLLSQVLSYGNDETQSHTPVCLLTALDRDSWYTAREQLIQDSSVNRNSLREIETSLFGLCIDEFTDEHTFNESKLHRFGDIRDDFKCYNRWFGLGLQILFTASGYMSLIYDHALIDGAVPYLLNIIPDTEYKLDTSKVINTNLNVELIKWELSTKSLLHLEETKQKMNKWYSDYDVCFLDFESFGKDLIKKHGLYYQGFIQLAIQLAYYKLYKQLTASYQTVSLASFREGRLEHPITVSEDMKIFVQSMTSHGYTDRERWKLMLRAIHRYKLLLSDTSRGHVFVKHMQALKYLAERENISVELFENSCFKLFIEPNLAISSIFTSFPFRGSFSLLNGHFIILLLHTDLIRLSVTSTLSQTSVNSSQLCREIEVSLLELMNIMVTQSYNGLEDSKL